MKNVSHNWMLFLCLISFFSGLSQKSVQIEVAPYTVPCGDTENEDCLQLLDATGSSVGVIPLKGIQGFTPEKGYEYTLDVKELVPDIDDVDDEVPSYIFQKEVSKMWVPQFATDAPILKGNFRVVGFGGRSINTNDLDLVLNANNSIMSGTTGCNNYHLFFKQLGYSLIFSKILATHLYCASRSALEEEYFVIFNSVHHFDLKGDVLRLYDISDKQLLEAQRIR